jgi:hypothetical protein
MRKKCEKYVFFASLKLKKKESDPEPDPDPFVRGTDPGIRIRTKMSRIRNTGSTVPVPNDTEGLRCSQKQKEISTGTGLKKGR